jgi:hypothetical protein
LRNALPFALAALLVAGCAAGDTSAPAQSETPSRASLERPYIVWDVTTERGHSQGSSQTGAGEQLWSVAPEPGDRFGVTLDLDGVVGLRFDTARSRVPGVLDLAGGGDVLLWTLGCLSWSGEARVISDLPHWAIELHGSCAADESRFVEAHIEGWSD